jgi:hypothetical protein
MAFQDTLAFLNVDEFGVSCTLGASTFVGILDSPVEVLAGVLVIGEDF